MGFAEYEFQPGGRLSKSATASTLFRNVGDVGRLAYTSTNSAGPCFRITTRRGTGDGCSTAAVITAGRANTSDSVVAESHRSDKMAASANPYSFSPTIVVSGIYPLPNPMHFGRRQVRESFHNPPPSK